MALPADQKGTAARPATSGVVGGWYVTPKGDCIPAYIRSLRSGTTFLYKALADVLPVAYLRQYDLLNYSRLLAAYKAGTIPKEAAAMDEYWAAVGCTTRLLDNVGASHASAEEHGFMLMAHSRWCTNHLTAATSQLFSQLCAKLVTVQECQSGVVLMKNPCDYGLEAEILRLYPNAKFIHIQRDMTSCLSSMLRILDDVWPGVGGMDPWLHAMLTGGKYVAALFIMLDLIAGQEQTMRQVALNLVNTTPVLKAEAACAFAEIRAQEPHRVHELTYEELMGDPQGAVQGIATFLGLEPDAAQLAQLGGRVEPRQTKPHPYIVDAMKARAAAKAPQTGDWRNLAAWIIPSSYHIARRGVAPSGSFGTADFVSKLWDMGK
ncbi:hypothetical protein WJX72_006661 [[Myrmecia] bisecta]|uniref:Sulfotransferase n=1 Tax=[Myrmecia] bisecta TaxID=41462 RepID=A0AAW1PDP1_9CHLO